MKHFSVTRRGLVLAACGLLLAVQAVAAAPAHAATTLHVCPSGCAYSQLADAIAAAHNGDTITLAPGTYAGGVTIDVSVDLVGAGATSTVISGGGDHSVLMIGLFGDTWEPTVSISGVTITGGVVRTSPESTAFVGEDGVMAMGGGVEIPPNADFTGGADVTITDSVITGNKVAPTHTLPIGPDCPSGDPCPFAWAVGGGVDNWGTLMLENTTVSDNRVGSASGLSTVASDANSGAIQNWLAPLTIDDSTLAGNRVSATGPNARFADSGAIFTEGGSLTMTGSTVTDNSAVLEAAMPNSVDTAALGGAIHVGDRASDVVKISNTTISHNRLRSTNSVGDANADSGAVKTEVNVNLSNDLISDNTVSVATVGASTGDAHADSAVGETQGVMTNVRMTGNNLISTSVAGNASAAGGVAIWGPGPLVNSVITSNHVTASAPYGEARAAAGALQPAGDMTLRNTVVDSNTATAHGLTGYSRGGGIFATFFPPDGPPPGTITLLNSRVTRNVASGSAGITVQGGGIYTTPDYPVVLTNSVLADNSPDQCYGC
jgi:hypothetical protein